MTHVTWLLVRAGWDIPGQNPLRSGPARWLSARSRGAGTMEAMENETRQARYITAMTAITRRLPFGLADVIAPSMLGYLLINLCTFFIDLGLLAVFHGHLRWPVAAGVPQ